MFKGKRKWIMIAVLFIGGGVFWYQYKQKNVEPATEMVQKGVVKETVSLTGFVEPKEYADLSFIGTGTIATVRVVEGEEVKSGATLFTLQNPVAQAQYQEAVLGVKLAENEERLTRRNKEDLKPEQEKAAQINSELAEAKKGTVAAQFVSSSVRAPFAGRVTRVDAKVGEVVAPGSVVARIQRGETFLIRASVSETEVTKLRPGMEAKLRFEALGDQEFTARLESLSESALQNQGVVTFEALFAFEATDDRLRDGMTADIEVVTNEKSNVLVLPTRALKRGEDGYTAEVYRGKEMTNETVAVTVGLEGDEGTVEILGGLKEGDRVIGTATSK